MAGIIATFNMPYISGGLRGGIPVLVDEWLMVHRWNDIINQEVIIVQKSGFL